MRLMSRASVCTSTTRDETHQLNSDAVIPPTLEQNRAGLPGISKVRHVKAIRRCYWPMAGWLAKSSRRDADAGGAGERSCTASDRHSTPLIAFILLLPTNTNVHSRQVSHTLITVSQDAFWPDSGKSHLPAVARQLHRLREAQEATEGGRLHQRLARPMDRRRRGSFRG